MTIKDRFIKCNLKIDDIAKELKTTPLEVFKALSCQDYDKNIQRKLVKRIEKEEKALNLTVPADNNEVTNEA